MRDKALRCKVMFCRKCGNEIKENEKFCSKCGAPCTEEVQMESQTGTIGRSVRKKKRILKKWWFWLIIVVAILGIIMVSSGSSEEKTKSEEKTTTETDNKSEEDTSDNAIEDEAWTKADLYEDAGENDVMPYTISPKAYDFIAENESLFPTSTEADAEAATDYGLEYRMIAKNPDNYGDKLLSLSDVYVMSISETNSDDMILTELQVETAEGNYYYIVYLGELTDIYEEDEISVYGLPLAQVYFDNLGGGTTEAIMLAGS